MSTQITEITLIFKPVVFFRISIYESVTLDATLNGRGYVVFFLNLFFLFSYPAPKADQDLFVVSGWCCHCKYFTFSCSPGPLGRFQPYLAQSITW